MHSRRASSSSSVFSFKSAAAASWKDKDEEREEEEEEEEEEAYDDSAEEEEEVKYGEEEIEFAAEESRRAKKKRLNILGGGSTGKKVSSTTVAGGGVVVAQTPLTPGCQVDECFADLTDSKRYHQRHKVCEYHSKAQVVIVAGLRQRFCQQCSRFHDLSEFDDAKRSCRRRLAGHNERRRKHFSESRVEGSAAGRRGTGSGSGSQMDKKQCRQVDERGRSQIAVSKNPQNFHIH